MLHFEVGIDIPKTSLGKSTRLMEFLFPHFPRMNLLWFNLDCSCQCRSSSEKGESRCVVGM